MTTGREQGGSPGEPARLLEVVVGRSFISAAFVTAGAPAPSRPSASLACRNAYLSTSVRTGIAGASALNLRTRRLRAEQAMSVVDAWLAIENGGELCSTDSDFSRFRHLRWVNPLAE